jgi:hypothetical protein
MNFFEDCVPTPAIFRVTKISKPSNTYKNISLPEYSPNQLERNDQELSENVFYRTTYFPSFPHTGSQSVEQLPEDYL